jgi:hypothetical protein
MGIGAAEEDTNSSVRDTLARDPAFRAAASASFAVSSFVTALLFVL